MCRLNNHPVSEIYSPCMDCPLYLETCSPIIFEGFTAGSECDLCICEYCPYTDCSGEYMPETERRQNVEEKLSDISLDTVLSGRQIRSLIIKNGYTVKEIQEILGLGCPQSVYNWLCGKTLPTVDNLYRMSKLFHVHMEDMLAEAQK